MAALAELRNSLRSGHVWVPGSGQFKDFEDYLLLKAQFAAAATAGSPRVGLTADGNHYLEARRSLLATKNRPTLLTVVLADAISDRYASFHTMVISTTVRDATHVLDGLLYHKSDIRVEEHSTGTLGFTDHVFFLCHGLGFRFAPHIRDLADRRLAIVPRDSIWSRRRSSVGIPSIWIAPSRDCGRTGTRLTMRCYRTSHRFTGPHQSDWRLFLASEQARRERPLPAAANGTASFQFQRISSIEDVYGDWKTVSVKYRAIAWIEACRHDAHFLCFGLGHTENHFLQHPVIDAKNGTVVATVHGGPGPRFLTAGAGSIWTLNQGDGSVARIDARTRQVATRITLRTSGHGGDISFGARMAWTTFDKVPLSVIDAGTGSLLCQWTGPGGDSLGLGHGAIWLADYNEGTVSRIALSDTLAHCRSSLPP